MGAHGALGWGHVTVRNDHEQVYVAVLVRRAPSVGPKEDDLFRLQRDHQTPGYFFQ